MLTCNDNGAGLGNARLCEGAEDHGCPYYAKKQGHHYEAPHKAHILLHLRMQLNQVRLAEGSKLEPAHIWLLDSHHLTVLLTAGPATVLLQLLVNRGLCQHAFRRQAHGTAFARASPAGVSGCMQTACMACSVDMQIGGADALSFKGTMLPAKQCRLSPAVVACARMQKGAAHRCCSCLHRSDVLPWCATPARAAPSAIPNKAQTERSLTPT